MKIKFLKLKSWLLVSAMGLLGLSSCHCNKQLATPKEEADQPPVPREELRLMYGVPTMDFHVRGQVTDPQGKPVKNIRVNLLERNMEVQEGELQGDPQAVQNWLSNTEVTTDKKGRFEIQLQGGRPLDEVRLLIRDVDGTKNGDYRNQVMQMKVEASDIDRSQAAGMYNGTYNKEVSVKLEKK